MKINCVVVGIILAGITLNHGMARPNAQITFKVTDDFGKPVAGATVGMATYDHTEPGDAFGRDVSKGSTAVTGTNGIVVMKYPSIDGIFGYRIRNLTGYYEDQGGEYQFTSEHGGKWQPWNPTVELVLRPIIKPVPMYAQKLETRIARPARKYGYDLIANDWVAPEGKGKVTDLAFELSGYANNVKDYNSTLTVSFANPMDGIQPFVPIKGSDFCSPREAPLDGYQDKLELRRVRLPGQLSPQWIDDNEKSTNYFFRVRTVLDENGKIKSALYGKIYGGFEFFGASTNGSFLTIHAIYLNPEPNSRNMEFDPKQNLFKGLDQFHQVTMP